MTAEEFLQFAEQHPNKRFDFMDGEIVEVLPKCIHGLTQALLASALVVYNEENTLEIVYTEVLHELNGQKFMPDVSANLASDSDGEYFTIPPLLAVEIRSDTQSEESQRRKALDYIKHGTKMVVLTFPARRLKSIDLVVKSSF